MFEINCAYNKVEALGALNVPTIACNVLGILALQEQAGFVITAFLQVMHKGRLSSAWQLASQGINPR